MLGEGLPLPRSEVGKGAKAMYAARQQIASFCGSFIPSVLVGQSTMRRTLIFETECKIRD
jgi:hypothetical protein